jgi:hypothetical protein
VRCRFPWINLLIYCLTQRYCHARAATFHLYTVMSSLVMASASCARNRGTRMAELSLKSYRLTGRLN